MEHSVHNLLVQSTIHCSLLSALLALWLLVVAVGDEGAGPVVPHVTLDEVPVDSNVDKFWDIRSEGNYIMAHSFKLASKLASLVESSLP